jgi:hypothetical protein
MERAPRLGLGDEPDTEVSNVRQTFLCPAAQPPSVPYQVAIAGVTSALRRDFPAHESGPPVAGRKWICIRSRLFQRHYSRFLGCVQVPFMESLTMAAHDMEVRISDTSLAICRAYRRWAG